MHYADDMVILAREWTGELTDRVESRCKSQPRAAAATGGRSKPATGGLGELLQLRIPAWSMVGNRLVGTQPFDNEHIQSFGLKLLNKLPDKRPVHV